MHPPAGKTVNVFIDESGTFDFSPKGSKYFILTAVSAWDCSSIFNEYFAESTVKTYLGNDLDSTVPFRLLLHASAAHPMLQVADYCCWAIAKKWKDGDSRSYEKIRSAVRTEFDVFRWGKTVYYQAEKT